MGMMDNVRAKNAGQKAYNAHVQANDLNKRGRMAEAKEKYEEAAKLYKEAYDGGYRKTNIMMSYAALLMRMGEFERALELMKEISKAGNIRDDLHTELRMNYSICLWRMGELDRAIDMANYVGKTCKNGTYYASMGTYIIDKAVQTGDFSQVKPFLEEANDYDEEDSATLDNWGDYYRLLSEREADPEEKRKLRAQAKDYYERAHKAKPSQITTLYALACMERDDGNPKRAKELADKALAHWSSRVCPVSREQLLQLQSELG